MMMIQSLLIAATVISFLALPAMAQTKTTETETNGHHYNGGPRSENHHMGKRSVAPSTVKSGPSGSHHYNGGPREPHHIGPR